MKRRKRNINGKEACRRRKNSAATGNHLLSRIY
jgi:hypothetical protein